MKLRLKNWIIILLLFVVIGVIWITFFNRKRICEPKVDLTSQVETGDLVFSVGESVKSDIVRFFGDDPDCEYSHVGIIIKDADNKSYSIVHMSSDLGVIASQRIEDFVKTADSSRLGFHRFRKMIDKNRIAVIVDSLVVMNKQFDNAFNMKDDTDYYCTEFVYKVLRDAGSEIYNDIKFDRDLFPDVLASNNLMYKYAGIE